MTIRIETDRLILRLPEPRDTDAHIAMMQEPAVAATLSPTKKPQARSDLWRQFASYLGHWQIRGFGFFSVEEKATGAWVGRVGPWMPEGWPGIECGWAFHSDYWGKGYAPEAAIASVRWTFAQFPDLGRIISVIEQNNTNSQAVAKKIGEEKSGEIFEYKGYRLDIWAANREAWLEWFGL
ncbi:MAG: GNAT family N-acetyltransferase [Alphaproteobacteria bacterium]|nr:GNAT family N-acetyltransferase [Alphaproteobacteria bacterium]